MQETLNISQKQAITHNESLTQLKLIDKSKRHSDIFNYLFKSKIISNDKQLIELDYGKFENIIKRFSEFAFQILKLLSIEETLEWNTK